MLYNDVWKSGEPMAQDVIASLGYLALGSRFKRLGERLQADVQAILDELGASVPSSQHPLLVALDMLGPLSIGELAESLGIAQPGVTRTVAHLDRLGLVEVGPSPEDQRRRIVSLS